MRFTRSWLTSTSVLLAMGACSCSGVEFSPGASAGSPALGGDGGGGAANGSRAGGSVVVGGAGGRLGVGDAGTSDTDGAGEAGTSDAGSSGTAGNAGSAGASGGSGALGNAGSSGSAGASAGSSAMAGAGGGSGASGSAGTSGGGASWLEVLAFSPSDGLSGARANSSITVTFNASIDPASVLTQTANGVCTGTLQLSRDEFATCVGFASSAPTMSSDNTVVTVTPAAALQTLGLYRIRVSGHVQEPSGLSLGGDLGQTHGFTVATDGSCASTIVISQVYGAGGNTGATFNADYVELHNAGATAQSLAGLSLQYAAATGSTWLVFPLPSVSIPPGAYYLVQTTTAGTTGSPLTADVTASPTLNFSATAGKVALARSTTALRGNCPLADTLDFLGYGSTADCSEGQPSASLSATSAAFRNGVGCTDLNGNSTDFVVAAPAPRNHSTSAKICSCTANETDRIAELDWCNLQTPATVTVQAGQSVPAIHSRLFEAGLTEATAVDPRLKLQLGYGASGTDPWSSTFSWSNAAYATQVGSADEYQGSFSAPSVAGTYAYTARATLDGTNWTYCDLDSAGSATGLTFDLAQLGVLTVTP